LYIYLTSTAQGLCQVDDHSVKSALSARSVGAGVQECYRDRHGVSHENTQHRLARR